VLRQGFSYIQWLMSGKTAADDAVDASLQRRLFSIFPREESRQSVLLFSQWAPKAQQRGKYYETSYLHLRSTMYGFVQRMHQTPNGVQPRQHFAIGALQGTVTNTNFGRLIYWLRRSETAVTVPHPWGGSLRFSNPVSLLPIPTTKRTYHVQ